jgi:hypothetical protein
MMEIKTVFIIILLIAIVYLIIKLYTYNTLIIENSKKIIIKNMEEHYEDFNERLDNIEEIINNKLDNYSKKLGDIQSYQNKLYEINKMNEQKVVRKFDIYDENLVNDDNNNIFNSIETKNNDIKEVKKNVFVKINNNDLFMSPNILNKTTTIEEDNKAQKNTETESEETSTIYEINSKSEKYKNSEKVIIIENE